MNGNPLSNPIQDTIAACGDCREACREALRLCLNQGGPLADPRLCLRLAEAMRLCQLCADWFAAGSATEAPVRESCARECEDAAAYCETFADPALAPCAAELRRCAAACRALGRHSGAAPRVTGPSTGPDAASIGQAAPND